MSNADYLLAWPNVASTSTPWTLSHRDASGEVEPLVASTAAATSTSAFYTIIPSLSSDGTSSYTAVTFLRLLTIPSTYPSNSTRLSLSRSMTSFIYASCSVNPQSTAETATLKQYDQMFATTSVDLSGAISLAATNGSSTVGSFGGMSTGKTAASGAASLYPGLTGLLGSLSLLLAL